jgi:hypothetical protein
MFEEFDTRTQTKIVRDAGGIARVLVPQDHYLATKAATPRLAARDYLRRYGRLFGVRHQHLKNLLRLPEHDLTSAGVEYRLLSEKRQSDLTTVSFHQTYCGRPIWEAGLSVTVKHKPLRVIGVRSTLHPQLEMKRPSNKAIAALKTLDVKTLAKCLGLDEKARRGAPLSITSQRFVIYHHDAAKRSHATGRPVKRHVPLRSGTPRLPLPPIHPSIEDGRHYVVNAVHFTFDCPPDPPLHWVALIEVETSSVLLLRPFVANVMGWVFRTDPVTLAGGPAANARNASLNRVRRPVRLDRLTAPVKGTQSLRGNHVFLSDVVTPKVAPPIKAAGKDFKFNARTNNFAAVNAYYHCDRVFRLVEDLGFSLATYFPGTKFPSPVDHRGHYDKNFPQGNEINAHCAGDPAGTGIAYTVFSLADLRNQKKPIGIACDFRIVLHELLGHGVLYNHIGGPLFNFAHSAGDSFAAIINDPDSKAPDCGNTLPWLTGIAAALRRRHDRTATDGWGWSGKIALNPFDNVLDPVGYHNEQILSSTMFRFYRAIGGDSDRIATRRFAARMACRILLAAIQTLTPATSPPDAAHFASALMKADLADWPAEGVSGGAYHKVIRWAFEKQGLYQRADTKRPNDKSGAPPPVDVYIEDGRHGEYQFQAKYWNCRAIWNRRRKDGGTGHKEPTAGVTNYAYLKIKNRGWKKATEVLVRAFHSRRSAKFVFPNDWQPMKTRQLAAANVPPNLSAEIVVGPFAWVPSRSGRDCILMVVSAAGDPSNVDNFTARDSIPDWRLVPNDNNIGLRKVVVAKKSGRRRARP